MPALDWLQNRADPRVQAALKTRCSICHQPPGHDCRHPWETTESLGRVVHQARAEAHLDKRKKRADG
jgi:hypothetical protein